MNNDLDNPEHAPRLLLKNDKLFLSILPIKSPRKKTFGGFYQYNVPISNRF
jgi:hypothetical protein